MHKIREILRLRWALGLGVRQAAASAGVGHSVVSKTSSRAESVGLDWDTVETLTDADLQRRLYGTPCAPTKGRAEPDPVYIHTELRRPGVTLELLHISNASVKGPDRNPDIEAIGPSLGLIVGF